MGDGGGSGDEWCGGQVPYPDWVRGTNFGDEQDVAANVGLALGDAFGAVKGRGSPSCVLGGAGVTAAARTATRPLSRMRWGALKKVVLIVGVIAALLAGSSGCSLIGDTLQQKTTTKENLELQRITAAKFKEFQPDVEVITFIEEGSYSGAGQWAANAIVVIAGSEYEEIIGPWTTFGDPLPSSAPSDARPPVTVHYTDGKSEVLR